MHAYDSILSINNNHNLLLNPEYGYDVSILQNFINIDFDLPKTEIFMILDMLIYLPENILFKVDRASMLNSLETRSPFLNNEIVEFANKIPIEQKIFNGKGKYILRNILENRIPKNMVRNLKKGFSVPIRSWINNELKSLILDTLTNNNLKEDAYLNVDKIKQIITNHYQFKEDNSEIIWNLFNYMLWKKN